MYFRTLRINYNLLFLLKKQVSCPCQLNYGKKKNASNYTPAANEEVLEQEILNTGPSR